MKNIPNAFRFKTKMSGNRNCQHVVTLEIHEEGDLVVMHKYYFMHADDNIDHLNRKIIRVFSWGTLVRESIVYRLSTLYFITDKSMGLFEKLRNNNSVSPTP